MDIKKYIVCWTLKENAEGRTKAENAVVMKNLLESLNGKILGIIHYEVAININTTDSAYDIALNSAFESYEALNAYQVHPEHLKVVKVIRKIREKCVAVDHEG